MTEAARQNYARIYPLLEFDFKVWMGQIILYCENVNLRLDE